MTKELAKTLTTALVQFIDRERPEGTMDCSSAECERIEKAFEGGLFDVVEKTIKKKLSGLTQFEEKLVSFALQCGGQWDTASVEAEKWSRELLALAREQFIKDGYVIEKKAFYDAVKKVPPEVMKEVSDNVDKMEEELTKFELALRNAMSDTVALSEDKEDYVISEIADKQAKRYSAELLALAKKELCRGCNANIEGYIKGREDAERRYNEGYNKGYEDAEKKYNESVAYHYQEPVPPGVAYKSPQCYTDVLVTPNTNSGTSTLKAEG